MTWRALFTRPFIQELTDATVDAFISDPMYDVIVEFYAPWCGHCKQFAPFYFEVGAHFARDQHVRVARIDVDTHRGAAARYNVTGLPSLQLFPKGYKTKGLHFKGAERQGLTPVPLQLNLSRFIPETLQSHHLMPRECSS